MPGHDPRIWNRLARGYARRPVADQASYERKLASTAAHLTPASRVIEIGCGTGTTALWHAPHVAHIDALDFSSEMIAIAREKAQAAGIGNVAFHQATLQDWAPGQPPASYDAALAMSILHLVPDLDDTLARLFALLMPGGVLCSSTVCLGEMGWLARRLLPALRHTRLIPAVTPLDFAGLTARVEAAGFKVTQSWVPPSGRTLYLEAVRPG